MNQVLNLEMVSSLLAREKSKVARECSHYTGNEFNDVTVLRVQTGITVDMINLIRVSRV